MAHITSRRLSRRSEITPFRSRTPFIIVTGESNAAGYALNTGATAGELAARSAVQIFNNTSEVFEDLDVGTNANIGQNLDNTTHGIEIGLCNAVVAGRFGVSQAYLLKSGYSGSKIDEWEDGDANWTTFVDRWTTAVALLGSVDYEPFIFYSQGINDSVAAVAASTWKTATIAHFAKLRTLIGASTKIVVTKLPVGALGATTIPDYNTAIDEICAADPLTVAVETSDITDMRDSAHWDAQGFRRIAERFVDELMSAPATTVPIAVPEAGSYTTTQTVRLSVPGGSVYYTTDGTTPTTGSTQDSSGFVLSDTTTVTAVGVRPNRRNSYASMSFNIDLPLYWSSTNKSSNITLSNGDLDAVSVGGAGFNTVIGTVGKITGKRYFEVKAVDYDGVNNNFLLFGVSSGVPGNFNTYVGTSGNPGVTLQMPATRLVNTWSAGTNTYLGIVLNSVFGVAVDMDNGKVFLSADNDFDPLSNGCDPATGTNPFATFTPGVTVYPAVCLYQNNPTNKFRLLSQGSLTYSPPSGFTSW